MKKRDTETLDAFVAPWPKKERVPREAPYQPQSESSREAARRITPKASDLRTTVLRSIIACGEHGATRKELEQSTGMLTQTLTPRLNELEHQGAIVKHSVLTPNLEQVTVRRDGCSVYVPTSKGLAAAA